jgi:hypothetical protein
MWISVCCIVFNSRCAQRSEETAICLPESVTHKQTGGTAEYGQTVKYCLIQMLLAEIQFNSNHDPREHCRHFCNGLTFGVVEYVGFVETTTVDEVEPAVGVMRAGGALWQDAPGRDEHHSVGREEHVVYVWHQEPTTLLAFGVSESTSEKRKEGLN